MSEIKLIEVEPGYVIEQRTKQLADGTTLIICSDEYGASAEVQIMNQALEFEWHPHYENATTLLELIAVVN